MHKDIASDGWNWIKTKFQLKGSMNVSSDCSQALEWFSVKWATASPPPATWRRTEMSTLITPFPLSSRLSSSSSWERSSMKRPWTDAKFDQFALWTETPWSRSRRLRRNPSSLACSAKRNWTLPAFMEMSPAHACTRLSARCSDLYSWSSLHQPTNRI